ncbi:hypothetical protein C0J52_11309 [Blattella germanica]|nr:hypothetical protein C0J52_11309 [Blattella germanica]
MAIIVLCGPPLVYDVTTFMKVNVFINRHVKEPTLLCYWPKIEVPRYVLIKKKAVEIVWL